MKKKQLFLRHCWKRQVWKQTGAWRQIYILDLVFIMPAFFITAIMTFRKNPFGYVLTPAMFILGIFVIFPLGLGELAKMLPQFNLTPDFKGMAMSFVLAGLFFVGAAVQLWTMKTSYGRLMVR